MTSPARAERSPLRTRGLTKAESDRFCSRCGAVFGEAPARPEGGSPERVCTSCGMGVVLTCPAGVLPGLGAAFLIVTADLRISAVSEAGERLFGPEGRRVGATLLSVVSSPDGAEQLAASVVRAASGAREVTSLQISSVPAERRRPVGLTARIAACGPPRAALIAVELAAPRT